MSTMQESRGVALEPVRATLNYSIRTGQRPCLDNDDYSRSRTFLAPAEVPVVDGAALAEPPTLDAEGFACLPSQVDVTGVPDSDEARTRYIAAMKAFGKRLPLLPVDSTAVAAAAATKPATAMFVPQSGETARLDCPAFRR